MAATVKARSPVSTIKYYANVVLRRYKALHIFAKVLESHAPVSAQLHSILTLDIPLPCHRILHMLRFVVFPNLPLST